MEGHDSNVYFDAEKQALVVQPLNHYMSLAEQLDVSITEQIGIYADQLKALEVGQDPEHALAMVLIDEGGANKVVEKKRGRQPKNIKIGSISVSFELPQFCDNNAIEIEKILAAHPHKKEVFVTPLEVRRFSLKERAENWQIEVSLRVDNITRDTYFTHIPSKNKFRSKPEVSNFILYEATQKSNNIKRKLAEPHSTQRDVVIGSTSKAPKKGRETVSNIHTIMEKEIKMKEWFPKQIEKNDMEGCSTVEDKGAKPHEEKEEYVEILEDMQGVPEGVQEEGSHRASDF